MIAFLLLCFFILLAVGFPIAVAIGLSSLLGIIFFMDIPLIVVVQRMFVSIDSFPLMAVPLYMLAGFLMGSGGISRRLINFSYSLVGSITGGLAHVNILASMLFAGISGSAVADTAGIGNILIPSMVKKKYSPQYSTAVTAISSTIGIIIPPSIPMVVIGAMLGVSVGRLFLGGIIPGILIGVALMVMSYIIAKKDKVPREDSRFEIKNILIGFIQAFWALLMPAVIVGSIVGGVITPTEAGGVAVLYSLIIGLFVYKELTIKKVFEALWETALATAKVFFIISVAGLYTWLLTANGFPNLVREFLLSITKSPTIMMLMIVIILLFVTTFMESIAALILLLPILYPVSQAVGLDPTYFGVLVVCSIGVGLVTPPVGICLYVASDVAKISIGKAAKAVLPFILTVIAVIGLLLFVPDLITFIPNMLMGK